MNRREYEAQRYYTNAIAVEYAFVFKHLVRIWPRTVLDVGVGDSAMPSVIARCGFDVSATDNIVDYWPKDMFNKHFHVIDDDITDTQLSPDYDFICSVSVMEHIRDHRKAAASLFTLLKPGGYLAVTFPYNEHHYIDDVYRHPQAGYGKDLPYIGQVFSRAIIDEWLSQGGARIVEQEYWQAFTGEFWTFGERLAPPQQVDVEENHQLTCLLMQRFP